MVILCSITDIAALAFAGQALVVASGGATTLIVNNLFAKYWHREVLGRWVVWGVTSVVIGATILAVFAPASKDLSLDDIMDLAKSPYFIAYVVLIFVCICTTLSLIASSWFYRGRRNALMKMFKPMREELVWQAEQQRVRERHMWRRMQLMRSALGAVLTGQEPDEWRHSSKSEASSSGNLNMFAPTINFDNPNPEMNTPQPLPPQQGTRGTPPSTQTPLVQPQQQPETSQDRTNTPQPQALDMKTGLFFRKVMQVMEEGEQREMQRVKKHGLKLVAKFERHGDKESANWWDPFIYAACSGIIGSVSILFASISVSVVKTSFSAKDGAKQWEQSGPYIFLILMLVCVVSQTHLLNKGLQLGEVLTVFPTFQAFFIGFGVVGGMVFYQQSADMSKLQWGMNVVGALFMLLGFFMLITSAHRVQRDSKHLSDKKNRRTSLGWEKEDLEDRKRESMFLEIGIAP